VLSGVARTADPPLRLLQPDLLYRAKPEATDLEQSLRSAPIRLRRQPEDRERARPGDRAVDLSNTEFD